LKKEGQKKSLVTRTANGREFDEGRVSGKVEKSLVETRKGGGERLRREGCGAPGKKKKKEECNAAPLPSSLV